MGSKNASIGFPLLFMQRQQIKLRHQSVESTESVRGNAKRKKSYQKWSYEWIAKQPPCSRAERNYKQRPVVDMITCSESEMVWLETKSKFCASSAWRIHEIYWSPTELTTFKFTISLTHSATCFGIHSLTHSTLLSTSTTTGQFEYANEVPHFAPVVATIPPAPTAMAKRRKRTQIKLMILVAKIDKRMDEGVSRRCGSINMGGQRFPPWGVKSILIFNQA